MNTEPEIPEPCRLPEPDGTITLLSLMSTARCPRAETAAEQSYRRGYVQGYYQALRDAERKSPEEAESFADKSLMAWRYGWGTWPKASKGEVWPPNITDPKQVEYHAGQRPPHSTYSE